MYNSGARRYNFVAINEVIWLKIWFFNFTSIKNFIDDTYFALVFFLVELTLSSSGDPVVSCSRCDSHGRFSPPRRGPPSFFFKKSKTSRQSRTFNITYIRIRLSCSALNLWWRAFGLVSARASTNNLFIPFLVPILAYALFMRASTDYETH